MPHFATKPTRIDATYDLWAIAGLTVSGHGLAPYEGLTPAPIAFNATLTKYRIRPDGIAERSPHPADTIAVGHPDLMALGADRPDVAAAVAALTDALMTYAAEQGKL
jgi:hypothetical protein